MIKKFVLLIMFVLAISFVSAATSYPSFSGYGKGYSSTNYQYQPDFQTYYGSNANTYWPILANDAESCKARQDIILQVAPAGCQPMVVRSDLLADQNVPVFCQIDALQVNPIIDIKEIKSISFTGNYPSTVAGVGFHPARAALNTRDTLLGSPLINNIGYAVVILKRTPNESALPKSVNVTLKGKITYNAGNAFGVGESEFYLTPTDDQKWQAEKTGNSFWKGRYFIRLEQMNENDAIVSIYDQDKKIVTKQVKLNVPSEPIYFPGSYCQFAIQLLYQTPIQAEKKARIEVSDGDSVNLQDVYEGSQFLNGKCRVSKINIEGSTGNTGNVVLSCGSNSITLERKASINVQGVPNGQLALENIVEGGGANYQQCSLVSSGITYRIKRLITNAADKKYENWQDLEYSKITSSTSQTWAPVDSSILDINKANELKEALLKACELQNEPLPDPAEEAFTKAIQSSVDIADNYPGEKKGQINGADTYGQIALDGGINLVKLVQAKNYIKKATLMMLLNKYVDIYPASSSGYKNEINSLYSVDSDYAVKSVNIDNKYRTVRLVSLSIPEKSESAKATFSYGSNSNVQLVKGEKINLANGGYMILSDFDGTKASVSSNCDQKGIIGDGKSIIPYTLLLRNAQLLCGQALVFRETDLKQVARIKILPKSFGPETETNLTVNIGIEKRAIQLSPDRTKDMIKNINKSIEKWNSLSEKLVKLETGLKAACFATSAVLTVKTFLAGTDGTAQARQQAMAGSDGWTNRCADAVRTHRLDLGNGQFKEEVDYTSTTQCFNDNTNAISTDIANRKQAMEATNNAAKWAQSQTGVTTNGVVDQDKAIPEMLKKIESDCPKAENVDNILKFRNGQTNVDGQGVHYPYTYSQLRDFYNNCQIVNKNNKDSAANEAMKGLVETSTKNNNDYEQFYNGQKATRIIAIDQSDGSSITKSGKFYPISSDGKKIGDITVVDNAGFASTVTQTGANNAAFYDSGNFKCLPSTTTAVGEPGPFLIIGKNINGNLQQSAVFKYQKDAPSVGSITIIKLYTCLDASNPASDGILSAASSFMSNINVVQFKEYGASGLYGNTINQIDRKVLYFASGADKDLPSQVPFDVNNGWYAKVIPSQIGLGSNAISNYDASGLPKSWQICNVGLDRRIDGGDKCQGVQPSSSGATILGLDQKKSTELVQQSQRALLEAGSQKGNKVVNVNGQPMSTEYQNPLSSVQCQNFMSPEDCKLLFNVCDPVICPPSRCDLGGAYRVANVQQTGIVGSALLCLPNIKDGVILPVCVSGIRNGIDAYVNLLKQHRDCLQQNLNDGRLVGICDEIQSVYMCEFFWRQVAPVASLLLPKLLETAYGQSSVRGGGEYLTVTGAYDNAKGAMNYFTQYYAQNTFQAYNVRSVEEAGTQFCRGFVSAKAPTSIKTLLAPDSPPQFTARFDAIPYSSVTVPATSQYKVFYFINAGTDAGVYYSVYLKNPPNSGYYYTAATIQVASGFITKGESASEAKDFTAPEGYQQLCVRINDKEECGFKQVSTDFSVNYLRDKYAQEEITAKGVETQAACTSGTPSLTAVGANLNPQAALEEAAMPQISQRGIIRVCASDNPGGSTDPLRYVNVGYCGDPKLGCWLDKNSVNNAITDANIGIKNQTLDSISKTQIDNLIAQGAIVNNAQAEAAIKAISQQASVLRTALDKVPEKGNCDNILTSATNLEFQISNLSSMLILNNHKAWLMLIRAEVKGIEAECYLKVVPEKTITFAPITSSNTGTKTSGEVFHIPKASEIKFDSSVLVDDTGVSMSASRIYYDVETPFEFYLLQDGTSLYMKADGLGISKATKIGSVQSNMKISLLADKITALNIDQDKKGLLNNVNGKQVLMDQSGRLLISGNNNLLITQTTSGTIVYNNVLFEFQDGTSYTNVVYRFNGNTWEWALGNSAFTSNPAWRTLSDLPSQGISDKTRIFITNLRTKSTSYSAGVALLADRAITDNEGGWFTNPALKISIDSKSIVLNSGDISLKYLKSLAQIKSTGLNDCINGLVLDGKNDKCQTLDLSLSKPYDPKNPSSEAVDVLLDGKNTDPNLYIINNKVLMGTLKVSGSEQVGAISTVTGKISLLPAYKTSGSINSLLFDRLNHATILGSQIIPSSEPSN